MFWGVPAGTERRGRWGVCGVLQTDEGILSRILLITGAVILLLGIAGIAVPYFTTEQTKDVASPSVGAVGAL